MVSVSSSKTIPYRADNHPARAFRVYRPIILPEFEAPYELVQYDICQLVPGTKDGFYEEEREVQYDCGPDPPDYDESCDSPHWED